MKKQILDTIKNHNLLEVGDHIVLGLSGGPDSMCLLNLLLNLRDEFDLKIYPVHINHCFRGEASDSDQLFVEKLCAKLQLELSCQKTDCGKIAKEQGISSEEAGRNVRYTAFNQKAKELLNKGIKKNRIKIATAQNANDQAETILFRIMRGTGIDGLSGIPYMRYDLDGFKIIRPILDMKRDEIEAYIRENNIEYVTDNTNLEPIYARNKIRLELLPWISREFNPNIVDVLRRMGENINIDKEFMALETQRVYDEIISVDEDDQVEINILPLDKVHLSIIFRIYNKALKRIGLKSNISQAQLKAIDKIRQSKSPSAAVNLTEDYAAVRKYHRIAFRNEAKLIKVNSMKDDKWKIYKYTPEEFKTMSFTRWDKVLYEGAKDDESQNSSSASRQNEIRGIFFLKEPYDADSLRIRKREEGDFIRLEVGRKKIKDLFQDMKIPKIHRDSISLFTLGHQVLWVMPSPYFPIEINRKKGRFSSDFKFEHGEKGVIIVLERE